jgi:hypothetical protein
MDMRFGTWNVRSLYRAGSLKNEELRDLYSSPSIIRIIKSRRVKWAGHVPRMGKKRNAYRLLVKSQRKRDN